MEDGTYVKKSKNVRETARVNDIKEKKERLKQEQIERDEAKKNEPKILKDGEFEIDENFGKKNKNRSKKGKKNKHVDSESD